METRTQNKPPEEASVIEHVIELLNNDDVSTIIEAADSGDSEKQIAIEFVQSYVQFLQELVEHDLSANLIRTDIEVRDLISHVNIMMKKKYEAPFMAMMLHSASHYRSMQAKLLSESNKEKSSQ